MSIVVIKYLTAVVNDGVEEDLLEELEQVLVKYAGEDWYYKYSVEDADVDEDEDEDKDDEGD